MQTRTIHITRMAATMMAMISIKMNTTMVKVVATTIRTTSRDMVDKVHDKAPKKILRHLVISR